MINIPSFDLKNEQRPDETKCPGGLAGGEHGLTNLDCSKVCDIKGMNCIRYMCEVGYFCPAGSISTRQHECGGADLYCPQGSDSPKIVSEGYYSVGWKSLPQQYQELEDAKNRHSQTICEVGTYCRKGIRFPCPAGKYSNQTGSNSCLSNYCEEGYFCPAESISPRQKPCGSPAFYCPIGSAEPLKVPQGFYSKGGNPITRTGKAICEPGFYCLGDGIKRQCPAGTFGSSFGLSSPQCDGKSAAGYYTLKGSTSSSAFPCPPGRYGVKGMEDELCMGVAKEGYYTTQASDNPRQHVCGGDMLYCPEGSSQPSQVSVGYFSVGGAHLTRSSQQSCQSYILDEAGLPFLSPMRPENAVEFWCPFSTRINSSSPFPWLHR